MSVLPGADGVASVKTRGELETEVSNAVIRFNREYMGRGPQGVRTFLVGDRVLVRLRSVLTYGGVDRPGGRCGRRTGCWRSGPSCSTTT